MGIRTIKEHPKHWAEGQIGEILVEEVPIPSKGNKYQLWVMLDRELPQALLDDVDSGSDDFGYLYQHDWEIEKVEKIDESGLPSEDWRLLEAIRRVDPKLYEEKYKGKPCYRFFITVEEGEDFEGYTIDGIRYSKDSVAFDAFRKWLEEEDYKVLTGTAKKISRFPWEQPKVTARVPLTKKMLEKRKE